MDREIRLLDPENLPLDLGKLGEVIEAELVMPSVYDVVLRPQETSIAEQAFIVIKNTCNLSDAVIRYGQEIPDLRGLLLYKDNGDRNPCTIINYELCRYKILHHLPLSEHESMRNITTYGAEYFPEFFGQYPFPRLTPWGHTTRYKTIANGLFWVESEQCKRGLAVAFPMYDDLSDGARSLAVTFVDGFVLPGHQDPSYIFFAEQDSNVPLFELLPEIREDQFYCPVDRAALMNAIYQYHPDYAALYNSAEQAGLNDSFGVLMNLLGVPRELRSNMNRVIRFCPESGIEFISF